MEATKIFRIISQKQISDAVIPIISITFLKNLTRHNKAQSMFQIHASRAYQKQNIDIDKSYLISHLAE